MCNYNRLSEKERHSIEIMLKDGKSFRKIAEALGRYPGSISREVNINGGRECYCHIKAQRRSKHQAKSKNVYRKRTAAMDELWICMLRCQRSPQQIEGDCQLAGIPMIGKSSIYNGIWEDKHQGGTLHESLRQSSKKRRKRYGSGKSNRGQIPNRNSISARPKEVAKRKKTGHWEGDLMAGDGHQGYLVAVLERVSGLLLATRVHSKNKDEVADAIIAMLSGIKDQVLSITYDNGIEFAAHERVNRALGCKSYFTDPFCSWQKGSIENAIGLVRQYYPKGQPLTRENTANLPLVIKRLNDRPRKRHGYLSPNQVFTNKTGVEICYN